MIDIKSILRYLSVFSKKGDLVKKLASIITDAETSSRLLEKKTLEMLGLKGSPKLSKVLVALGVQPRRVELALNNMVDTSKGKYLTRLEGHDHRWVWEQGDSDYYTSCQYEGSGEDCREFDSQFLGKTLFFWTIGLPKSEDKKGFVARAKCRVMFEDYKSRVPAALYIERPYGGYSLLFDHMTELIEMWDTLCRDRGWGNLPVVRGYYDRAGYEGDPDRFWPTPLWCPSATDGYQDTLTQGEGPYTCFYSVSEEDSILERAYKRRPKSGGVYEVPLSATTYNAQKDSVVVSARPQKSWRGVLSATHRVVLEKLVFTLGKYDSMRITGDRGFVSYKGREYEITWTRSPSVHIYLLDRSLPIIEIDVKDGVTKIEIHKSLESIGFVAPDALPLVRVGDQWKVRVDVPDLYAVADINPVFEAIQIVDGEKTVAKDLRDYGYLRAEVIPTLEDGIVYVNRFPTSEPVGPWAEAVDLPYIQGENGVLVVEKEVGEFCPAVPLSWIDDFLYSDGNGRLTVVETLDGYCYRAVRLKGNAPIEWVWGQSSNFRVVVKSYPEEGFLIAVALDPDSVEF